MATTVMTVTMMTMVLLLLVCVSTTQGKETRRQYCGDRLTSKLFSLCRGLYNKRGHPPETGKSDELLKHILRDIMLFGGSAWGGVERRRRGVVDECCRRGCTITELEQYCLGSRK